MMPPIIYTNHLKLRMKIRKIQEDYPRKIYKNPEQEFFDNTENTHIAIKKLHYNKKVRNMMIAYEKKDSNIEIITIHPITEEKIINRIIGRRWIKK